LLFSAIALQPTVVGCRNREEIKTNLNTIRELMENSIQLATLEAPVKLIVLPEGAVQGWLIDTEGMDHVYACRNVCVEIPGPETDFFSQLAVKFNSYIYVHLRAVWPELIKDRTLNSSVLIAPNGDIVLKAAKTVITAVENSVTPYDIWDLWVEKFGDGLGSFYPVVDTEIGRIGTIICKERCFPETAKALAVQGAEIMIMTAFLEPLTSRGALELQTRARAFDNVCYTIASNHGPLYNSVDSKVPWNFIAGQSLIADYKGNVIAKYPSTEMGFCSAVLNVDELREYRKTNTLGAGLAYAPADIWKKIYEKDFRDKNSYIKNPPPDWKGRLERHAKIVKKITEEGLI